VLLKAIQNSLKLFVAYFNDVKQIKPTAIFPIIFAVL
jgi:hypothetical protein